MTHEPFQLPEAIRKSDNLPSLPSVAIEVLRLSKDPDAGIDDLVEVISADPAISLKILKLANSPQFRRGSEVSTLSQAAIVLGMKSIKLLALSFSLANSLSRGGSQVAFEFRHYWTHSLTTAVAARSLARLVKSPLGEEAFLAGLLARIGQLVMATTLNEQYANVLEQSQSTLPTPDAEQQVLGYDYHQVGGALLREWALPEILCEAVKGWDDSAAGEVSELGKLLKLSNAIATLICEEDRGRTLNAIHAQALDDFGVSEAEIDDFVVTLEGRVTETASDLDIDIANTGEYQQILDEARQQMLQVSLDTVVDLSQAESRAERLDAEAKTDKLTSLPNRAHFDLRLRDVVGARLKGACDSALGILVMDIDHFKSFNDTYGHAVGDKVLATVAAQLSKSTRRTDFTARYGGEEFVVILPNTSLEDLESVAERLRSSVEEGSVQTKDETLSVTISVGGACVTRVNDIEDGKSLVELADECLYEAKRAGRNRCVCREVQLVPA